MSCPLFTVKGKDNCSMPTCRHPHPPSSAGIGCDSREHVKTGFSCKEQYSASPVGSQFPLNTGMATVHFQQHLIYSDQMEKTS